MPKSKSLSDLLKLYKDHFSLLKIKKYIYIYIYKIQNKIQFRKVSPDEVKKKTKSLNKKKKLEISSSVSVKHLTQFVDTCLPFLTGIINQSFKNSIFPDEFMLAEVKQLMNFIK